jgi:hypothetical protein
MFIGHFRLTRKKRVICKKCACHEVGKMHFDLDRVGKNSPGMYIICKGCILVWLNLEENKMLRVSQTRQNLNGLGTDE